VEPKGSFVYDYLSPNVRLLFAEVLTYYLQWSSKHFKIDLLKEKGYNSVPDKFIQL